MQDFSSTHAALFDQLERQGAMHVDIAKLAQAVLSAQKVIAAQTPRAPYQRCANGACDG
jgi:streptomycin 6-kinase